ncbi:ATP-dependent DNA helicase-like protein recQ [Tricharina praecox]|uniref:ATP-dependent DNA helicase-like protein recQ n=1 Tax=Tricharina praecox TaxID=43433 RepID=UPI00222107B5|nr:ATP-dependent DNA helicase-like protein recQ [Tricharina praecox]KAI5853320.1 ATP-dependent DNA helicase-like protein recQ [Tricharina praecox]
MSSTCKRSESSTHKPKRVKAETGASTPRELIVLQKLPPLEIAPPAELQSPVVIDPRATEIARRILSDVWGYPAFRLEQEAAITRLICGGSAAVVFPTGGGKSLVYQVSALAFDLFDEICGRKPGRGVTLVVSPLIALMKDQTEALKKRGVKAAALDSSQDRHSVLNTYDMLRSGELKLLYVAPERLNNEAFVETIKEVKIRMVAVDEAHCVSEWGQSFRPDYLKVARFAKEVNAERVLCLTATAAPKVANDILVAFDIAQEGLFKTPTFRPNLHLNAMAVESQVKKKTLLSEFLKANPGPSIIYVTTHAEAQMVSDFLVKQGFTAAAYHAGLATDIRTKIQDRFMASKDMIIAATIAFGMGVDKADIRNIVHFTVPKSLEGYSQEIGRAGRDGLRANCMLYLTVSDIRQHESFSRADVPSLASVTGCLKAFFGEFPHAEQDHVVEANMYSLGKDWDIRPGTLTLLFAQLEIRFGILRAITPKYSAYSYTPNARFSSLVDASDFISKAIVTTTRKAKSLSHIDVDATAEQYNTQREQIIRKLQTWSELGAIDLKPSGVINRFRVLKALPTGEEIARLARETHQQMELKERENIERVRAVVELLAGYECYAVALADHFGDELDEACGACGFCVTATPVEFEWPGKEDEATEVDMVKIRAVLKAVGQDNWDDLRFLARVAWGITSPRSTRLKVAKTPAWGCCEGVSFEKLVKAFGVAVAV